MSYGPLFRHRWRLSAGTSSLKTLVRMGSIGGMALVALGVGLVAEDAIRTFRLSKDPLRWVNGMLLALGALYVVGRGYQGTPSLRPYLSLPIPRKRLVRFGLGYALLHPVNLAIFAFGLGLWGRTVVPAHSWMASAVYGVGLLLGLGGTTHLSRLFSQWLARRPLRAVLLVAGGGIVFILGVETRLLPVFAVSEALFGGLLELEATSALLLAAGYAGSAALHRRQMRRRLSLDAERDVRRSETDEDTADDSAPGGTTAAPQAGAISRGVDRLLPLVGRGKIGALVAMEWRLASRNRQPRRLGIAMVLPVFTALMVGVGAVAGAPVSYSGWLFIVWGTGVGAWVVDYGTKVLSWEGRRLEGLLTRALRPRDLLDAKVLLLGGGTLFLWFLPLPVIVLAGGTATGLHAAFLLYVLGWGLPVALAGAPFNAAPIDLNDRSLFNAAETDWGRIGASVLLIGPAIGLFGWADSVAVFAGGLAVVGALSALCAPLWIRLLRRVWRRRHPAILEDFREATS